MPLRERITSDRCGLQRRWILDPTLAVLLVEMERRAVALFSAEGVRLIQWPGFVVISGHRSVALQARVNPDAPDSLHTRCPSLAVDLRVGDLPATATPPDVWAFAGGLWKTLGGRWGGDFSPPDLNHFDLLTL